MIIRIVVFILLFCIPAYATAYRSYEPWGDGYLLQVTPKSIDELEITVSGGSSVEATFCAFHGTAKRYGKTYIATEQGRRARLTLGESFATFEISYEDGSLFCGHKGFFPKFYRRKGQTETSVYRSVRKTSRLTLTEIQRAEIQKALSRLGHYNGRLTGKFDNGTRKAIASWKSTFGQNSSKISGRDIKRLFSEAGPADYIVVNGELKELHNPPLRIVVPNIANKAPTAMPAQAVSDGQAQETEEQVVKDQSLATSSNQQIAPSGMLFSVGLFSDNRRQGETEQKWLFHEDGSFWIDGAKVGAWIDDRSDTKRVTALFGDRFEELLVLLNGSELLAISGTKLRFWGKL